MYSAEVCIVHEESPIRTKPTPTPSSPSSPSSLECVEEVLARASRTFGIPVPAVHWFRPLSIPDAEGSYERLNGFVEHGRLVVWLNVGYETPQGLAVTTAHEATHYWQNYRRGPCLDDVEHAEREGEAQRRADLLVPKGMYRAPRGKRRDAWFEPARRRYPAKDRARSVEESLDIAPESPASVSR